MSTWKDGSVIASSFVWVVALLEPRTALLATRPTHHYDAVFELGDGVHCGSLIVPELESPR